MRIDSVEDLRFALQRLERNLKKAKKPKQIFGFLFELDNSDIGPIVCEGDTLARCVAETQLMSTLAAALSKHGATQVTPVSASLCGLIQKFCSPGVHCLPGGRFGNLYTCLTLDDDSPVPADSAAGKNTSLFAASQGILVLLDVLWRGSEQQCIVLRTLLILSLHEVVAVQLIKNGIGTRLQRLCSSKHTQKGSPPRRDLRDLVTKGTICSASQSPVELSLEVLSSFCKRFPTQAVHLHEQNVSTFLLQYCENANATDKIRNLAAAAWCNLNQVNQLSAEETTRKTRISPEFKTGLFNVLSMLVPKKLSEFMAPVMTLDEMDNKWNLAGLLECLRSQDWRDVEQVLPTYGEFVKQLRYQCTKPHQSRELLGFENVLQILVQGVSCFCSWPKHRELLVNCSLHSSEVEFVSCIEICLSHALQNHEVVDTASFFIANGLPVFYSLAEQHIYNAGLVSAALKTLLLVHQALQQHDKDSAWHCTFEEEGIRHREFLRTCITRRTATSLADRLLHIFRDDTCKTAGKHETAENMFTAYKLEQQLELASLFARRLRTVIELQRNATEREAFARIEDLRAATTAVQKLLQQGGLSETLREEMEELLTTAFSFVIDCPAGRAGKKRILSDCKSHICQSDAAHGNSLGMESCSRVVEDSSRSCKNASNIEAATRGATPNKGTSQQQMGADNKSKKQTELEILERIRLWRRHPKVMQMTDDAYINEVVAGEELNLDGESVLQLPVSPKSVAPTTSYPKQTSPKESSNKEGTVTNRHYTPFAEWMKLQDKLQNDVEANSIALALEISMLDE